jgi:hypothetical protein
MRLYKDTYDGDSLPIHYQCAFKTEAISMLTLINELTDQHFDYIICGEAAALLIVN